jgi:hypothetical protein
LRGDDHGRALRRRLLRLRLRLRLRLWLRLRLRGRGRGRLDNMLIPRRRLLHRRLLHGNEARER